MKVRNGTWMSMALATVLAGVAAVADDIRPESDQDARPLADEKCIEQCDTQSDQCMQDAAGDDAKMQACDDQYSQCLQACEAG